MSFFPRTPNGSFKTRIFVVLKLCMFISFSNQVYFENEEKKFQTTYSTPIGPHLTIVFKGLVFETQIPNLILTPSFDYNF